MPVSFVKCAGCGRDYFPRQLVEVHTSQATFYLGPDCWEELRKLLSDKQWMGSLIKATLSLGEVKRLQVERALSYARTDFSF